MEEKSSLRKKYKAIRESLLENAPEYSLEICKKCAALPEFRKADTVLLYFAKGSEADLSSLFEIALKTGKRVAYPRCLDRERMEFFEIFSLSDLEKGYYGIMEPKSGCPACTFENAVCFVPALSFDLDGYRLGYGGGYYDRFLSDFFGTTVGIAFEKCISEKLPREEFDKKTDYIITERRVKRTIED